MLKICDSRARPAAGKVRSGMQEGGVLAGLVLSPLLAEPVPELGIRLFLHCWVTLHCIKYKQRLDHTVNPQYLQFIIKS